MNFGEVVVSPYTWILIAVSIAGCWYAKRRFLVGSISGWVAPLILTPFWMVVFIAFAGLYGLLWKVFPELMAAAESAIASWPEWVTHVLHPATLVTAAVFFLYCKMERVNTGVVSGHVSPVSRSTDQNPFSRAHRG